MGKLLDRIKIYSPLPLHFLDEAVSRSMSQLKKDPPADVYAP